MIPLFRHIVQFLGFGRKLRPTKMPSCAGCVELAALHEIQSDLQTIIYASSVALEETNWIRVKLLQLQLRKLHERLGKLIDQ